MAIYFTADGVPLDQSKFDGKIYQVLGTGETYFIQGGAKAVIGPNADAMLGSSWRDHIERVPSTVTNQFATVDWSQIHPATAAADIGASAGTGSPGASMAKLPIDFGLHFGLGSEAGMGKWVKWGAVALVLWLVLRHKK